MHGHSAYDYDPDTGLLRGDHYRDQAETTEKREALAAAWALSLVQAFFMTITEEHHDSETASDSGADRDRGIHPDPYGEVIQ